MAMRDDDAYFGIDQRLDDAMKDLETERNRLGESERRRAEERTTVKAKDQSFSATFDGRGDLVDLAFHGNKYRSMAPGELSKLLVSTIQRGRLDAIEKMAASMSSPALAGVDLAGIATGKVDLSKALDSILNPILGDVSKGKTAGDEPRG